MTRIYLNELAPWQRKNEYYKKIQLGKDLISQTEQLKEQTKEFAVAQLENSNNMIASHEKIQEISREGFADLSYGLSTVSEGIEGLKSAFEWGISEVVWQIEQSRETLKSIEEGIWSPYDAQARNKKKQAEEAYSYGWINEAECFFLESEEILQTDFSVHMSLGMIYLFKKIDKQKALLRFEKAAKYARPKSDYYTSIALMHKAMIHFDFNQVNKAIENVKEAINLTPDLAMLHYQLSQYFVESSQHESFATPLRKAIELDKFYSVRVQNDVLFNPVREEVNALLALLTEKEKELAKEQFLLLKKRHEKTYPLIQEIEDSNLIKSEEHIDFLNTSKNLTDAFSVLEEKYRRDSYFDYLDLNNEIIPKLKQLYHITINMFKKILAEVIKDIEREKDNVEKKSANNKTINYQGFWATLLVGSFVVPMLAALIFLGGWDKFAFLFWAIPGISQIFSVAGLYFLIIDGGFFVYPDGVLWSEGDVYIVWSVFLFLIVMVIHHFVSRDKSNTETETVTSEINKALDLANRINANLNTL